MKTKILKIIHESYPVKMKDVEYLYDICESYDDTIEIIELSIQKAISIFDAVTLYFD